MTISYKINPFCKICRGTGKVQAPTLDDVPTLVFCPSCALVGAEFKYEQPSIGHKAYLVVDDRGRPRLCLAGYLWAEQMRSAGASVEPLYTAENARAAVAVALQYRGDEFERMQFEAAYLLPKHLYFSKSLGQYRTQGNTVFARECADDASERLGVWIECAKRHSAPAILPPKSEEV